MKSSLRRAARSSAGTLCASWKPNSQTAKQIASFSKAREKIFTFLLDPNIPPDNNSSERAIRNIKTKIKVSGQFKSDQGAQDYATIRSIIDTARKQKINEFEALRDIVASKSVCGLG
jgi:transposase